MIQKPLSSGAPFLGGRIGSERALSPHVPSFPHMCPTPPPPPLHACTHTYRFGDGWGPYIYGRRT
jgi:hypothetical protein